MKKKPYSRQTELEGRIAYVDRELRKENKRMATLRPARKVRLAKWIQAMNNVRAKAQAELDEVTGVEMKKAA